MIPPAEEGESKRATRMRSFIAEVRGQALNDVLPTDGDRVFYAKPWWQRVIVMFAGPFHNLILAVVFFTVVLIGVRRTERHTTQIAAVPACVLPAGAETAAGRTPARSRSSPGATGQTCDAGTPAARCPRRARRRRPGCAPATRSSPSTATPLDPTDRRRLDGRSRTPSAPAPTRRSSLTIERDGDAAGPHRHPDREHRLRRAGQRRTTTAVGYVGVSPAQAYVAAVGHRRARLPRRRSSSASVDKLVADPAAGPAAVPARRSSARSATRKGRSASSASAGSPARCSRFDAVHHDREDQLLLPAARRRQPGAVPVQPAADLPARRRARRRRAVREGPRHGRPAARPARPRARSTSPG